jgi:hypothetical protein
VNSTVFNVGESGEEKLYKPTHAIVKKKAK